MDIENLLILMIFHTPAIINEQNIKIVSLRSESGILICQNRLNCKVYRSSEDKCALRRPNTEKSRFYFQVGE